jgi:hypothetical protein
MSRSKSFCLNCGDSIAKGSKAEGSKAEGTGVHTRRQKLYYWYVVVSAVRFVLTFMATAI